MNQKTIDQFRRGSESAFRELYDTHADGALRLARVITRSDYLAADAVQEAFLRVYVHRKKYDPKKPFKIWLNKILVNECKRLLTKRQRDTRLDLLLKDEHKASTADTPEYLKYEALYRALEDLNDDQRIPLVLKYLKGFSEQEIAGILGIRSTTVKSRLYHGRQKLKKTLVTLDERGIGYESV